MRCTQTPSYTHQEKAAGGGGSRSGGGGGQFKSMLQLYNPLPPHVHVCWGFSKIFGVAGWRAGVLVLNPTPYTLNPTPYTLNPKRSGPKPYTLHPEP